MAAGTTSGGMGVGGAPGQTIMATASLPLKLEAIGGPSLEPLVIRPGSVVVLGRSAQCGLVLPDEGVSRRHAQISHAGQQWFVTDLGSRHGTFVNAVQLATDAPAPLRHGDLLVIGPWTLRVRLRDHDESASAYSTTLADRFSHERVERVAERELAAITRNRLNLLIEVAAAVAGSTDAGTLSRMIARAAVRGTGFPRAAVLHAEGPGAAVRAACVVGGDGSDLDAGDPGGSTAGGPTDSGSFSRSLLDAARGGEVVRLTSDGPGLNPAGAESVMRLGIQTALCAPVPIGQTVGAFLYLDARAGERAPDLGSGRPAATVQNDAAAYLSALAKMYGLALGNIARQELERRQRELERDLTAAREAQRLIMPPESGSVGPVRYAMRCLSGRHVAGDLFDVVPLSGGRVGVFLGDVAGKGIGAAILMATAQTHLHLSLRAGLDAAAAVRAVNDHLCSHVAENRFVSLWLGVFDPSDRSVTYVDAGHGHWVVRPGDGRAAAKIECDAGGIPLGIECGHAYTAGRLVLDTGARVVVFSDGVVEQPGDGGEQFQIERVVSALATTGGPDDDVRALFDAVLTYAGPGGATALADDTTAASVSLG